VGADSIGQARDIIATCHPKIAITPDINALVRLRAPLSVADVADFFGFARRRGLTRANRSASSRCESTNQLRQPVSEGRESTTVSNAKPMTRFEYLKQNGYNLTYPANEPKIVENPPDRIGSVLLNAKHTGKIDLKSLLNKPA